MQETWSGRSWSGRSPREGNGNPLQYSYLGNPTDRSLVGYSPCGCKRVRYNSGLNNSNKHLDWEEFKGTQGKTPTPDSFMKYGLFAPSLHWRGNYFSLFLRDIISRVIINERLRPGFGKWLMVSIIQTADSSCVQLSLATVCRALGSGQRTRAMCVALPPRVCTHRLSLSHPSRLGFHTCVHAKSL